MGSSGSDVRRFGVTLLRVSLGVYYVLHAWYGWGILGMDYMTSLNARVGVPFPGAVAWLIVVGHLVGGLLLVLGLYTRLGALINVVIMTGATFLVHLGQGFFMKGVMAPGGNPTYAGYEFALFMLIATVAILFLGSGPLALKIHQRKAPISLD